MTYPQGGTPENSANYDSLAAFAAKTEEEWEAELRGEQRQPWDFLLKGFFQDLDLKQPFAVAVMGGIAEGLGLGDVWEDCQDVINALQQWVYDIPVVGDILYLINEAIAEVIAALTGVPGDGIPELEEWSEGLIEDVEKLFKDLTNLLDDLWHDPAAVIGKLYDVTVDGITSVGDLLGISQAASEIANTAQNVAEAAFDLGQEIVDSVVQGFHGWWNETGFAPLDLQTINTTIATAVAELNAAIVALQSSTAGTAFSGTAVYENFTAGAPAYPNGQALGARWDQWYEGSGAALLGINNNYAVLTGTSLGRTAYARYKATGTIKNITSSNRQRIGLVASVPANWGLRSYNYIYGRMAHNEASTKKYVFAKLSNNTAEIGYRAGGGEVIIGSAPNFRYKNGAIYWFESGFGDSDRTYRLFENSTLLLTVTDASNASLVGAEYRGVGFGMYSPNSVTRPGVVAAFAFHDNAPMQVLGSGLRRCRTIGTTAKLSKGNQPFPKGWFTTSEYMTRDLTYNSDTNTVTVGASGWYAVDIVQYAKGQIGLLTGGLIRAALYRNGQMELSGAPVNANANTDMLGFGGHFVVYANKGDTLTPYYISEWECADYLRADSAGKGTWFAVAFLGNTLPVST
jgi:hypothetical protein